MLFIVFGSIRFVDSVMGRDGACMEKKGIEYRVLVRKSK
jgi:hypothetical protein